MLGTARYTTTGVLKLLTLGMFGVWWLFDIAAIASGWLRPDGLWEPLY